MFGACAILFGEMCISMEKNILSRMAGDIGKETRDDHSLKSIYGHNAAFLAGL